ncbi:MAG: hypothetical protein AAGG55_10150 [Pseudomonadota bacterium]
MNGWPLFWLLSLPMTAFLIAEMLQHDLSSPQSVSEMIGYSVRWGVPFIFFVTAASAMPVLFPNEFTRWWVRSRRYVGLVFAVAMAWQGAFIFIMSNLHTGYYYEEVYYLRDELEGSSGYIFLAAMVFTSFRFGRRLISATQWKVLHRCGVYFLWAYPFSVYWWNLYYYGNPDTIDYVFYWAGFLAFAVRIAAWGKRRYDSDLEIALPSAIGGWGFVGLGAVASATGLRWQDQTTNFLTGPAWSGNLEIWLPFWPLEPFLPLFALGVGAWLLTGGFRSADKREPSPA